MTILNTEWLNSNSTRWYPLQVPESSYAFPKDLIVDAVLFHTKLTDSLVAGSEENILYGFKQLQVVNYPSRVYRLHVREFFESSYNPANSSTYRDIGYFEFPQIYEGYIEASLISTVAELDISGKIVINKKNSVLTNSVLDPLSLVIEPCRCIPAPKPDNFVRTIESESVSIFGDVVLVDDYATGKGGLRVLTETTTQGESIIELQYYEQDECPEDTGDCLDDRSNLCYDENGERLLWTINGVPGDNNRNVNITGIAPIQVSALPRLKTGGIALNPDDYETSSLIVHYHGHIMLSVADDGSSHYGLVCKWMPKAQINSSQLDSALTSITTPTP